LRVRFLFFRPFAKLERTYVHYFKSPSARRIMPELESDLRKLATDARLMAEENARLRSCGKPVLKCQFGAIRSEPGNLRLRAGLRGGVGRTRTSNQAVIAKR
jgi:hypothetical protein